MPKERSVIVMLIIIVLVAVWSFQYTGDREVELKLERCSTATEVGKVKAFACSWRNRFHTQTKNLSEEEYENYIKKMGTTELFIVQDLRGALFYGATIGFFVLLLLTNIGRKRQ